MSPDHTVLACRVVEPDDVTERSCWCTRCGELGCRGTRCCAEVRLVTSPGDYVFVPPWTPHREENPGTDEAVLVIARGSQEGVAVNLPSLFG